jgi:3-oxoacyl-[acyl-carrier-protein] synthase III
VPGSTLVAVHCTLGSENLTYEDIESRFGAEAAAKVFKGSGIRNRRVAAPGVCGSDLAFQSAGELLEKRPELRERIDLVVHCTQTPDYLMPTTACLLQERLKLRKECAAFDINLGCSQYVYGLSAAHSMLCSGVAQCALVTTGDTMTQTTHPRDRAIVPILGDAGSASLLVPAGPDTSAPGFLGFELGTDGSGAKHLMIPASGFRLPRGAETAVEVTDAEGNTRTAENFYMNGSAVFHFAITVVPATIHKLLAKLGLTLDDLDLVLFHQANQYMLDYLHKKLKIPSEKSFCYLENVGNTSGSTLPVVLTEAIRQGRVKAGGRVLMIGFGVGLSWGATVFRASPELMT